jgi:hypothetical protein
MRKTTLAAIATLVAAGEPVEGEEGPPSRELLSFEVSVQTGTEASPEFGVIADGGDSRAEPKDVRWHVHRVET